MIEVNLPLEPGDSTPIAKCFSVQKKKDEIIWFHGVEVIARHTVSDIASRNSAIFILANENNIPHSDISRGCGISRSLVKKIVAKERERREEPIQKIRRGCSVLTEEVVSRINADLKVGKNLVDISKDYGIKMSTLRKGVNRHKLAHPIKNPNVDLGDFAVKKPPTERSMRSSVDLEASSLLGMACVRTVQRTVGVLYGENAKTEFEDSNALVGGGVLTALPSLIEEGLFAYTKMLENGLEKCYYTVTHILTLLAFMALLRIKSPERLRGWAPGEIGRLMGLDRNPEVSTLRRWLNKLGNNSKVGWQEAICKRWLQEVMKTTNEEVFTLYIDGHIHAYSGNMTRLPKHYATRRRLCVAGVNDYYINDNTGLPLMRISRVIDEGLAKTIENHFLKLWEDLIPRPDEKYRKTHDDWVWFRLIFDRAGSNPSFISWLKKNHIIAMTYKKNVNDEWKEEEFKEYTVVSMNGETETMLLAERLITFGNGDNACTVREIRKLVKGEKKSHQTSIITTDMTIKIDQGVALMFARWNQENFFKYMVEEYGLDHLLEYETEDLSQSEMVVNPTWRTLENSIQRVQGQIQSLLFRFNRIYADLDDVPIDEKKSNMSQDNDDNKTTSEEQQEKIKSGGKKGKTYEEKIKKRIELRGEIVALSKELDGYKDMKTKIQRKVSINSLNGEDRFKALAENRKNFVDLIKMASYRAESAMADLIRKIAPDYADNARTFLQQLYQLPVDIMCNKEEKYLEITLHPFPEIRKCEILDELVKILNGAERTYPGTDLIMHYSTYRRKES